MARTTFSRREADFLNETGDFGRKLSADATRYGATVEQAAEYQTTHSRALRAFEVYQDPVTKSPANRQVKDTNLRHLRNATSMLVDMIQAWPAMNDDLRAELGIHVPDRERTPSTPPTVAPRTAFERVRGRRFWVRLSRGDGGHGKPAGVTQATIMSSVGEAPAERLEGWTFQGNTTKTLVDFTVSGDVEPGAKVWVVAVWGNRVAQTGPVSEPIAAHVQFGDDVMRTG